MDRVLALLLAAAACAAGNRQPVQPFDAARFESLRSESRTVVLLFSSANCPICPQQEETLRRISEDGKDLAPAFLRAPFSPVDPFCQQNSVTSPSTLLVFRGKRLIGRATGIYSEEEIRALIQDSRVKARGKPGPRPRRTVRSKR